MIIMFAVDDLEFDPERADNLPLTDCTRQWPHNPHNWWADTDTRQVRVHCMGIPEKIKLDLVLGDEDIRAIAKATAALVVDQIDDLLRPIRDALRTAGMINDD